MCRHHAEMLDTLVWAEIPHLVREVDLNLPRNASGNLTRW